MLHPKHEPYCAHIYLSVLGGHSAENEILGGVSLLQIVHISQDRQLLRCLRASILSLGLGQLDEVPDHSLQRLDVDLRG